MAETLYEILPRNTTLFNLASKKLVTYLWKNVSTMDAVNDGSWKFYAINGHFVPNNNFDLLTNHIVRTLNDLLIHNLLTLEVSYFVKPIGLEICIWLTENKSCMGYLKELLNSIIWSRTCQIDRKSSISCFIGHRNGMEMFNRACYYCVEELIPSLWTKLPDYAKHYYRNISKKEILLSFWVHAVEDKMDEFVLVTKRYCITYFNPLFDDDPYFRLNVNHFRYGTIGTPMVYFAVANSNCYALKYFMPKFETQRRSKIARGCILVALKCNFVRNDIVGHEYADVVFELYFHMNLEDEMRFLKHNCNIFILMMTKYYRYRNFLTSTIEKAGRFINPNTFAKVMELVFKGIKSGQYLVKGLLRNIWNVSPVTLQSEFFGIVFSNIKMLHIFEEKSFYISKVLLKDIRTETKNGLFSFFEI